MYFKSTFGSLQSILLGQGRAARKHKGKEAQIPFPSVSSESRSRGCCPCIEWVSPRVSLLSLETPLETLVEVY